MISIYQKTIQNTVTVSMKATLECNIAWFKMIHLSHVGCFPLKLNWIHETIRIYLPNSDHSSRLLVCRKNHPYKYGRIPIVIIFFYSYRFILVYNVYFMRWSIFVVGPLRFLVLYVLRYVHARTCTMRDADIDHMQM